jgi:hypothetical protein
MLDPELVVEARRWRRLRVVSLVLATVVGETPVLGFAAASAAASAAAR